MEEVTSLDKLLLSDNSEGKPSQSVSKESNTTARRNWQACCSIIKPSNLAMISEVIILRAIRFLPALIFISCMFQSVVHFLGDGISWHEVGNLFECKEYWWTPFLFVNDLVPFYVKDFRGCMRFTALVSIEMKLFVFLPFIVKIYQLGLKQTAITICLSFIFLGFLVNGYALYFFELNPSYLNLMDFMVLDTFALKPWIYIDSYFTGILFFILYQEFKILRKENQDILKEQRPRIYRLIQWIEHGFGVNVTLISLSLLFFIIFVRYHSFIDETMYKDGQLTIEITQKSIQQNVVNISLAKLAAYISVFFTMLLLVTGRSHKV